MRAEKSPIFRVQDGERVNEMGQTVPNHVHVSLEFAATENPSASAAAGRKVFDCVLYVNYHFPGSRDSVTHEVKRWRGGQEPSEISNEEVYRKFAEIIEAFEKKAAIDGGLPIAVLNLDVTSEAELRSLGIMTVEALAEVPDSRTKGFSGGLALRERARKFLEAQADAAPRLAAEAAAEAARREMEEMRADMEAMRAELLALRAGTPPAPRRGRPPKER